MTPKRIQKLHIVNLKLRNLAALNKQQKATLAMVSFALSEINALRRLALFSLFSLEKQAELEQAAVIQRNLILRTLTGKLFEFLKFFDVICSGKAKDKLVLDEFITFKPKVSALKSKKGYQIAKTIRNSISNHYDIDMVMRCLSSVPDSCDCSMYLTDQRGNCYFPMGENVVFAGIMSDSRKQHAILKENDIDVWVDWTSDVSELIYELHKALFLKLVHKKDPTIRPIERNIFLDPDLVGDIGPQRLPLFHWSHG